MREAELNQIEAQWTEQKIVELPHEKKKVKTSGSELAYIHDLSVTFFCTLHNSHREFVELFGIGQTLGWWEMFQIFNLGFEKTELLGGLGHMGLYF